MFINTDRFLTRIWIAIGLSFFLQEGVLACQGDARPRDEQLLVLKSGRVLQGEVQRYGDSYIVRWGDTGKAQVAERLVDFSCDTIEEAYKLLRQRITRPSINSHLALADWCLSNGLLARARINGWKRLRFAPTIRGWKPCSGAFRQRERKPPWPKPQRAPPPKTPLPRRGRLASVPGCWSAQAHLPTRPLGKSKTWGERPCN